METVRRVLIMGAAGRDFHNFNVVFRDNPAYQVVAFTAFQIPNIAGRVYPPVLAGSGYPRGIPIFDESDLPDLVRLHGIDEVVFSYSDVAHLDVMHRASLVNALGADFRLLGGRATMLHALKPVIAVCAVRTGCGKSPTSRRVAQLLDGKGRSVVVVRHPMPYGADLNAQRCQRFAALSDLDDHGCTIEEREEYESHIANGHVVYAGVDYGEILRRAEAEADIILWDGGNNDIPFYRPELHIVLVDPHRPGHEVRYHPGETNLRMADVAIVSKVDSATPEGIREVEANIRMLNPAAEVLRASTTLTLHGAEPVRGKRVLVVEDGPTLTHGDMRYGAARIAASAHGAAEVVDPRPYAVGSIRETFEKYPHLTDILPAMGYGKLQVQDLEATINAVPCDVVMVGTPFDLGRLVRSTRPMVRVSYDIDGPATVALDRILDNFLSRADAAA